MSTPQPPAEPTSLIEAIAAARRAMPRLPKSDSGVDENGKTFWFPSEEDLHDAVDMVFDENGLMLLPDEACFASNSLTLTWTLHHLPTEQVKVFKMVWPAFDSQGYLSRAHATGATWSHAWRHLVCKLLDVKTEAAPPGSPQAVAEEARRMQTGTARQRFVPSPTLDREVGEMPRWAAQPLPRAPVDTSPSAQWAAAGAIVEPAPAPIFAEVLDVWAAVCTHARLRNVPKPWDSALAAWKVFAGPGHERDALAPNDDAFKRWLLAETGATLQ